MPGEATMIPDWEANCVYFSDLLPDRHPGLWARLAAILDQAGVGHRLLPNTRDIWCRDYMPVQVAEDDFVLFRYEPSYLRGHDELITPDEARRTVPFGGRVRTSAVNLDGGNVAVCENRAILTEKIYKENRGYARPALREEVAAVLRADCIFIPNEPYDVIGHADGVVRFVDSNTVVVNEYREAEPAYGRRLEAVLLRHGLTIKRLPYFQTNEVADAIPSAVGNYVNFLRVGRLIVVPAYGVPQDDLACRTLEQLLPQTQVIPLRVRIWHVRAASSTAFRGRYAPTAVPAQARSVTPVRETILPPNERDDHTVTKGTRCN